VKPEASPRVGLDTIVDALADPAAYPHPVEEVDVLHTHISVVFRTGELVYKVKKPLDLGFLDFTTLERRRHFCREEVRLNRRLAPEVYRGVVPLLRDGDRLRIGPVAPPGEEPDPGESLPDASGRVVEYAVQMEQLPDDATLRRRLRDGGLSADQVERVGRRIAEFHRRADSGPEISRFGRWEVVAGNARENFQQTVDHVGDTVSAPVHRRCRRLTDRELERVRGLVEERADRDVPRDNHGDLHLDHVYLFPGREPPRDLRVLDCIEFNDRLRFGDPMADLGFLYMDLCFEGRRDLADQLSDAYFREWGDAEGRELLPFYTAYRAAVRAKVEGMAAVDPDVPEDKSARARRKARAHWLLTLGELAPPGERPCLVLLGGLPATGKSTLARGLADRGGFRVVSSDRTRKELAGLAPDASAAADFEEGIYSPSWTERTYAACREAAERALFRGERVLVDASFRHEERRRSFLELGREWAVPVLWIVCRAELETVRARLAGDREGPSDADMGIYRSAAGDWDEPGAATDRVLRDVETDGPVEATLDAALEHLREAGLLRG
jgi:aminoglycoside phosphotransferase family enzyme/predicted kinase